MSNYMNVLKRLDESRRETAPRGRRAVVEALRPAVEPAVTSDAAPAAATPAPARPAVASATVASAVVAPAPLPDSPVSMRPIATPALPARAGVPAATIETTRAAAPLGFAGFASLFDRIQLLAQGRERYVVVLAPASHRESIGRVMSAMVAHAEQRHERAFFAELRGAAAARGLVPRGGQGGGRDCATRLCIDPADAATSSLLSEWLDTHAPGDRLVLLEAPPLSDGLDAALLARACDGLIVVAESEVTDREALRTAGERARASGCNALGIAMIGTSDPMPGWLARILRPDTTD